MQDFRCALPLWIVLVRWYPHYAITPKKNIQNYDHPVLCACLDTVYILLWCISPRFLDDTPYMICSGVSNKVKN